MRMTRLMVAAMAAAMGLGAGARAEVITLIDDGDFTSDVFVFGEGFAGFNDVNGANGNRLLGFNSMPAGQSGVTGIIETGTSYDPNVHGFLNSVSVSLDAKKFFQSGPRFGVSVAQAGNRFDYELGVADSSDFATAPVPPTTVDLVSALPQVDWNAAASFGFYAAASGPFSGIGEFDNFNVTLNTTNVFPGETAQVLGTGPTSGGALGGTSLAGGVEFDFANVLAPGQVSAKLQTFDEWSAQHAGAPASFYTGAGTGQVWDVGFDGAHQGDIELVFRYDESWLGDWGLTDEQDIFVYHFDEASAQWEKLGGTVDAVNDTVTVVTDDLSPFVVAAAPPPSATSVEYTFEGVVSTFSDNLIGGVAAGDPFTATLRFDTSQASGTDFGSEQVHAFPAGTGAYSLEVEIGGAYAGSGGDGTIKIVNDFGAQGDWFQSISGIADGFAGDPINGLAWTQTTLTFKDYDGLLYSDTSLPDELADLSVFEEQFATLFFGGGAGFLSAEIERILSMVADASTTSVAAQTPTPVLDPTADGGLVVTTPAGVSGAFSATYNKQAAAEVDPVSLDFFIVGDIFQTWDLDFDGALDGDDFVELIFTYDDTGMSLFDELTLDVLHFVDGQYVALNGVVDTQANTITAHTASFSPFVLASLASNPVPEPGTLALLVLGAGGLWMGRRRRPQHGSWRPGHLGPGAAGPPRS